jgi:hypothetical protein
MDDKSNSIRDDLKKEGYSKEEEYFYRVNQELIEKRRRELDATRAERQQNHGKSAHWMRCPKCGNQMKEINLSGIYVDQCEICHGVFFDHGEFETLFETKGEKGFLRTLVSRFRSKMP